MDNHAIARVLSDVGDLLEIKGANPFKIRAYRQAADVVGHLAERVAYFSEDELRTLPGIGKDLSTKIRELAEEGTLGYLDELLQEFPPTILDLLRLRGVGPRTVALLYRELAVDSLDALEAAARAGRVRSLKGLGPRKEQQLLQAVSEHRSRVGRHLLHRAEAAAQKMIAYLRQDRPDLRVSAVGSLRRRRETCGDIDLLAVGEDDDLMDRFTSSPDVSRVLGQGSTRASVRLTGDLQIDLRLVAAESAGAAAQYFAGYQAQNIALRDRALRRGLTLTEYGLIRSDDDSLVAGDTEESIYAALDLDYVPPELREHRGELAAAEAGQLPLLIETGDLRGDLHCHTDASDGKASLEQMGLAARDAGLEYLAITDHSQALAMANGLDETRALRHAARIRALNATLDGITLLAGIECDILADGRLDLSDGCLAELDLVVASVHSSMTQERDAMTDRLLRALDSPVVDILGHPTGRLLLRRRPVDLDVDAIFGAAAERNVALEINSQPHRLDLSDSHARLARERGVRLVISSDAHAPDAFARLRWGVAVARRAWLEPADVLNTQSLEAMRSSLRRHHSRSQS